MENNISKFIKNVRIAGLGIAGVNFSTGFSSPQA
jgi:hypothetical protein